MDEFSDLPMDKSADPQWKIHFMKSESISSQKDSGKIKLLVNDKNKIWLLNKYFVSF